MPVIVRKPETKKPPSTSPEASASSLSASAQREIPTAVFVIVIALVVLIAGVIAYRMFAPGETWDNTVEGAKPTPSALTPPPQLKPSGGSPQSGIVQRWQGPVDSGGSQGG